MTAAASLKPTVADIDITAALAARAAAAPDHRGEALALQELGRVMADEPAEVLPRLVKLAMEICGADSAGVSVLESEAGRFRWLGLAGSLAVFEGATTPRDYSPCGVCLDRHEPVLMAHPELVYDWVRDAGITVPEVLLVPLFVGREAPLGTLWIVAPAGRQFNQEHARALAELATFTGLALRMIRNEQRLKLALREQETLAHEMNHRVKNIFALVQGLIRSSAQSPGDKEQFVEGLTGRVQALSHAHDLSRGARQAPTEGVPLAEIFRAVMQPHGGALELSGPDIDLTDQATQNLAIVAHELATNAAKYGALSRAAGKVRVSWARKDDQFVLDWEETGGPAVTAPATTGFGSRLIEAVLRRHQAQLVPRWHASGLAVTLTAPLDQLCAKPASEVAAAVTSPAA
jgi:two-component sensor histidine kinase